MLSSSNFNPKDLSLYLVLDRQFSSTSDLERFLIEAVTSGVSMLQLREKNCSTRDFIALVFRVKEILKNYSVPIIINDRVDVALATDVAGVHIGQSDMPYALARKILPSQKILGLSIENLEQLELVKNEKCIDYFGVGPIFPTSTKLDAAPAIGVKGLKKIRQFSSKPMVAIGGINLDNAKEVIQSGVEGLAVVSAICNALDVQLNTQRLQKIILEKDSL